MSVHPIPLTLKEPPSPTNSSKTCTQLLRRQRKNVVAYVLILAGVLTLAGTISAVAFPPVAYIIILSLAFCLIILCCLLDFINTKTSSGTEMRLSSLPHRGLLYREDNSSKGKSLILKPFTIPSYNYLLTTHWSEPRWRSLPHKIRPLPDSVQQAVWQLNSNPGIILISTVGDVTQPRTTSECTLMMVNPSDLEINRSDLFWGRYAFYDIVSPDCWNKAKETLNAGILTPGTCSKKCIWETIKGERNSPNTGLPFYFSHVYNPLTSEYYNPGAAFHLCKETYIKCFEEAVSGEIPATMVQIPLLFSEADRKDRYDAEDLPMDNPNLQAAKSALVAAIQEFSDKNPNTNLTIVIVKEQGMPIEYSYMFPSD
ncbi:hypothetical protein O1W69_04145 [Chlamydia sp. 12-01]|uniref:hypothetical protein n=1 Tax=Chlamydia sp. 12-01 TaxID=3002742 RepID=UPI0035D41190